jgi:hypothetical protein
MCDDFGELGSFFYRFYNKSSNSIISSVKSLDSPLLMYDITNKSNQNV